MMALGNHRLSRVPARILFSSLGITPVLIMSPVPTVIVNAIRSFDDELIAGGVPRLGMPRRREAITIYIARS